MTGRMNKYLLDRQSGVVPTFLGVGTETSGDNTLVLGHYRMRIRVYSLALYSADGVVVYFRSGAGGTAITGSLDMNPHGELVMPHSATGWFETEEGESLELNLSAAVYVGGCLVYGYV